MTRHIAGPVVACAILICFACVCIYAEQGNDPQLSDRDVRTFSSPEKMERKDSLNKLQAEYFRRSQELIAALEESAGKYNNDHTYHSPLHCAIAAVETWHVLDADTRLLSMVDYQLDALSVPRGEMLLGEDYYPAVRALVRLRVDAKRVLKALRASMNTKQLRLLAYVLSRRVGAADEVRAMLENAKKTGGDREKQNFAKAMELLEQVKHPSDLLLPLGKGGEASDSSLP